MAVVDFDPVLGALDVTGAENVEVEIRSDGQVLWINDNRGLRLRICGIDGAIAIRDRRTESEAA